MSRSSVAWMTIVLAGLGTYLIRVSFLLVRVRLSDVPEQWLTLLRMTPPAVLSALIAPAVLRSDGSIVFIAPEPIAVCIAGLVALWTRSMLATIIVGILAVTGLRLLFG